MKKLVLISLMATAVLFCACDKKSDGDSATGVKECDDYHTALEACIGKMPEAAKKAMADSLAASKKAMKAATQAEAKAAMAKGCKAATDALKANPACK